MIEQLGRKAIAIPALAITLISLVVAVLFYPMMHAEMRDVPLGVANLDAGAQTPAGEMNAGAEMASRLSTLSDAFAITVYESKEEAEAALADNEVYGVLMIPEDFTEKQVAAQMGAAAAAQAQAEAEAAAEPASDGEDAGSEGADVIFTVNMGKNTMLATQLSQLLPAQLENVGLTAEVQQVNTADVGGGMLSAMSFIQALVMPLFLMSMMSSILLYVVFRPLKTGSWKRTVARQAPYIVAISALVAGLALAISVWALNLTLPAAKLFAFFWLASACLIFLFVGALDVAAALGIITIVTVFALGMLTAMLPREMMPGFWRDWVCPWVPQYQIADGIRQMIYFDSGIWTERTPILVAAGIIGMVLLGLASLKGRKAIES